MKKLLLASLLVACIGSLAAVVDLSPPAAEPVAVNIDFAALHQQANVALEKLQQRRSASANVAAAF